MKTIASPYKACIFVLSFMFLFLLLIINGCKKDESSPTAPATQPSFAFTLDGTSYSGEATATYYKGWQKLVVGTRVTSKTGSLITLDIYFGDTSNVKVNKTFDMGKGSNYSDGLAHLCVGDTTYDNTFCSGTEGSGTLTVTKWNGLQISATFAFRAGTHTTQGDRRFCNVTNGTFEAKSIQVLP